MSVEEMKLEVISKITTVGNEGVLKEILALLKNADEEKGSEHNLSRNYEKIKNQYGDVLQKLAQ